MNKKTGIIGTGRLGKNLIYYFNKNSIPISGIFSINKQDALETAKLTGTGFIDSQVSLIEESDIIFIATPDDIIEKVADEIAGCKKNFQDKIFFHCSGSLPSTILNSLKDKGAETGSLHPLQSFAGLSMGVNPFEGIIMGIEGSRISVEAGKEIALILGAIPYTLKTEAKTLYHAAAVVASNYLVSLTDMALIFLEAAGIEKKNGLNIIAPLMKGTLKNVITKGPKDALTGPVSRGDSETIKAHREKILEMIPEMDSFYKLMCRHTIGIANKSGSINQDDVARLKKSLD